jgi:hypothetical protein
MAATFAVPYAINHATKRLLGIDYYTGEIGLKDRPQSGKNSVPPQAFGLMPNPSGPTPLFAQSSVFSRFTATQPETSTQTKKKRAYYARESWQNGNKWPLLLSLLPLPVAAGMFDTVHWKGLKPFSKAWRNALDFSKSAPFTTQQQMAATFALLITSRLMASRSDNEFRERLIDSGLGWGLWILGTPAIKRSIAGYLDKRAGQAILLKDVPVGPGQSRKMLRTKAEIDKLAGYMDDITPRTLTKAQQQLRWLSHGSLLASLALLGIVEPFIAIQWTRYNENKKARQANMPQASAPLPLMNPAYFSQTQQASL